MDKKIDVQKDKWIYGQIYIWKDGCMDRWIDGNLEIGYLDIQIDGQKDIWIYGQTDTGIDG